MRAAWLIWLRTGEVGQGRALAQEMVWHARGNDGTEARALDDNVGVGFAAHLCDHGPDELALAVAVGPDHEVRRPARLLEEVLLNAALVGVLREERRERAVRT